MSELDRFCVNSFCMNKEFRQRSCIEQKQTKTWRYRSLTSTFTPLESTNHSVVTWLFTMLYKTRVRTKLDCPWLWTQPSGKRLERSKTKPLTKVSWLVLLSKFFKN